MSNYTKSNEGMMLVLSSVMSVAALNDKYVLWYDATDGGGNGMWIVHRWVNMAGTISLLYGQYYTDKVDALEAYTERSM